MLLLNFCTGRPAAGGSPLNKGTGCAQGAPAKQSVGLLWPKAARLRPGQSGSAYWGRPATHKTRRLSGGGGGRDWPGPWRLTVQDIVSDAEQCLMTDLWRTSASDLAALVLSRELSAREVTENALARFAKVNPAINAVVTGRRSKSMSTWRGVSTSDHSPGADYDQSQHRSSRSRNDERTASSVSSRFGAGELHHLAPLLGFVRDKFSEVRRTYNHWRGADFGETRLDARVC
jgi:hypothetical protein